MSMRTGENDMGLRKIIDMTRMISMILLLIHFYTACYQAFLAWGFTHSIGDRLLNNIRHTAIADGMLKPKLIALGFLFISLLGVQGRKDVQAKYRTGLTLMGVGLLLYFASWAVIWMP